MSGKSFTRFGSVAAEWPIVRLREVIHERSRWIEIDDSTEYSRVTARVRNKGIQVRDKVFGSAIKTKRQKLCEENDFLVAEIDAKVGGFGIVPADGHGAIVSSHYFLFEVVSRAIDLNWLDHVIRDGRFQRQVDAVGSTNYAAIRPRDVGAFQMPLPALAEQRAIADVLGTMETAIRKAESLIEATTRSLNTTLDWFLGDRRAKIAPTAPLGSIIESMKYGTSAKCDYGHSGVPVLRIPNVLSGGIDLSDLKYAPISTNEAAKYALADGDLLAVRTNGNPEYVGRMALVQGLALGAAYASYLIRIRVDRTKVMPEFVWLCSQTYPLRDTLTAAARTSAGNYNINSDGIRSALIPLPDIQTQERIVAVAEALRNRCDAEISYLFELRNVHRALAQELLSGRIRLPESMIARHADAPERAA